MKKILLNVSILTILLFVLNFVFVHYLSSFVVENVGKHNGKENFLINFLFILLLFLFVKGGVNLYKKNFSILTFSIIVLGLNLLLWFLVLINKECVNCSLV